MQNKSNTCPNYFQDCCGRGGCFPSYISHLEHDRPTGMCPRRWEAFPMRQHVHLLALHLLPTGHGQDFAIVVYFEKINSVSQIQRTNSRYDSWPKEQKYMCISKPTLFIYTDAKLCHLLLVYKRKSVKLFRLEVKLVQSALF